MTDLVLIDEDAEEFVANGVKYRLSESVSIDRLIWKDRFALEAVSGLDFTMLLSQLKEVRALNVEALTTHNWNLVFEAAVKQGELMQASNDSVKRYPKVMWLNTLYWNEPGEDIRFFEEDFMRNKIRNWEVAGIDPAFFYRRAESVLGLPRNAFSSPIMIYSTLTEAENQKDDLSQTEEHPTN